MVRYSPFIVDGIQILKVRYMPLEYTGFGYYTFGKQELAVDDVEFIHLNSGTIKQYLQIKLVPENKTMLLY